MEKLYDHAAQAALEVYNKIFGTTLSGDFEGYLAAKVPGGGTLRIFASGDVVMLDATTQSKHQYPIQLDDLRAELVQHAVAAEQDPISDAEKRKLEDSVKKPEVKAPANRAEFQSELENVLRRLRETVGKAVQQGEETASILATRGEQLKQYRIRARDLVFNGELIKHYLLDVENTSKLFYLLLDAEKTKPKPANLSQICDMVLVSIGLQIGALENVLHDFVSKLRVLTLLLLWVKEPWASIVSESVTIELTNMEGVEKEITSIKEDAGCIVVPVEA
jgi:hypothetical protein